MAEWAVTVEADGQLEQVRADLQEKRDRLGELKEEAAAAVVDGMQVDRARLATEIMRLRTEVEALEDAIPILEERADQQRVEAIAERRRKIKAAVEAIDRDLTRFEEHRQKALAEAEKWAGEKRPLQHRKEQLRLEGGRLYRERSQLRKKFADEVA